MKFYLSFLMNNNYNFNIIWVVNFKSLLVSLLFVSSSDTKNNIIVYVL